MNETITRRIDGIDAAPALVRDGYRFILEQRTRSGRNLLQRRLLGVPLVLLGGRDGCELFYDGVTFERSTGGVPMAMQKTLFGIGGVQVLDDGRHRARKAMFLDSFAGAGTAGLVAAFELQLQSAAARQQGVVSVFDLAAEALHGAALTWTGVPRGVLDGRSSVRALLALPDGPGSLGRRHWQARASRLSRPWRSIA